MVNMKSRESGKSLEVRSKELFDESVERLDARTRSRLTQARHAALDEVRRSRRLRARWLWAPAGGLIVAGVAALLIGVWPGVDPASPGSPALEDLEVVAGTENLDLLQDVEFYTWLADQGAMPADANSG
jgi:hypothetical protein